ncbi:protease complex subunit PrcB family protein [Sedimentibacter hydroxybenzoicus DSM 7310]|uniref:Protease complex subunit PrcB family protein n=1 Tax=Sedimentibacter hydroxybenzoicus DSM 7310 TaxID=1123245 RepID=A0A974GWD4_SEDHY|nr:protease complex subunit PrcB family protein [Sedimentibacter hydroxybenzoicus]NYB73945.1 protease complex subunit PrcB family protein [Sedimentibacter hydroxybenzoicus DSM 7310]
MKRIITIVAIIVFIAALLFFFRYIRGRDAENVGFDSIKPEDMPRQITEVLPNYRMKEKALVAKVNDEIYVVVTRGEKNTAGYEVEIDKLTLTEENGENILTVYAEYTDPKPGDVTAQILTYPFAVVRTDLQELPQKVILEKQYKN